ncbi:hypothetical protein E8E13_005270 [Curvularia kusanoi]|uniref:Uncharacterized protein n=1 Tax=Curvularia kusanoi TaxID=90978 RepID=A0A9P4W7I6_CURKU|nr:hypothetical protein E8E13_005270 [Curvularia kusanoi]
MARRKHKARFSPAFRSHGSGQHASATPNEESAGASSAVGDRARRTRNIVTDQSVPATTGAQEAQVPPSVSTRPIRSRTVVHRPEVVSWSNASRMIDSSSAASSDQVAQQPSSEAGDDFRPVDSMSESREIVEEDGNVLSQTHGKDAGSPLDEEEELSSADEVEPTQTNKSSRRRAVPTVRKAGGGHRSRYAEKDDDKKIEQLRKARRPKPQPYRLSLPSISPRTNITGRILPMNLVDNDMSFPITPREREGYVQILVDAMRDIREAQDEISRTTDFRYMWLKPGLEGRYIFDETDMERVCRRLVAIAEGLHAYGLGTTEIYCPRKIEEIQHTPALSFRDRIEDLAALLRESKARCTDLMVGNTLETTVALAAKIRASHAQNRRNNKKRSARLMPPIPAAERKKNKPQSRGRKKKEEKKDDKKNDAEPMVDPNPPTVTDPFMNMGLAREQLLDDEHHSGLRQCEEDVSNLFEFPDQFQSVGQFPGVEQFPGIERQYGLQPVVNPASRLPAFGGLYNAPATTYNHPYLFDHELASRHGGTGTLGPVEPGVPVSNEGSFPQQRPSNVQTARDLEEEWQRNLQMQRNRQMQQAANTNPSLLSTRGRLDQSMAVDVSRGEQSDDSSMNSLLHGQATKSSTKGNRRRRP